MSIEFSCKNCSTTLRVPDEHLGKQARCPKCQELNVVQNGSTDPAPISYPNPSSYPASSPVPPAKVSNPYAVGQGSFLPPGGVAGHAYQSAHRGGMILTLGILAIACNLLAIPGIMAWVMGRGDLKQMDAGRMDPEGRGLTQAGMIMGIIGSIFQIIGLVIFLCYILFIIVIFVGMAGAAANGGM